MGKISFSIPKPCHENWQAMTPEDKGRFCASCQKKVFDFTRSSDREIVTAFQQNRNLCGRFLNTQLNRDLVKPKVKSSVWVAVSTTVISLLGTKEIVAQESIKTDQTDSKIVGKPAMLSQTKTGEVVAATEIEVLGIVSDRTGPLPAATITSKRYERTVTADFDGKFTIKAIDGDTIVISFIGYEEKRIIIDKKEINPHTNQIHLETILDGMVVGLIERRRTFFGRIFHSIGTIFRK